MKRFFAAFIAAAMLALAACTPTPKPEPTSAPEPTAVGTILPTSTVEPSAAPATDVPTDERSAQDEAFEALAMELFVSSLISDGQSYHQLVKDPNSYGIDPKDVERGWGELSYNACLESVNESLEYLKRLEKIDSEKLLPENKIAYDNLIGVLADSEAHLKYFYYDEPLIPINGDHTSMPLVMIMYEINSVEDVENYLYLLEDMPRYIAQIADFELEKSAQGLFMTENALDKVIASCEKFAATGEDCFLLKHLEAVLEKADFAMTDEQKEGFLSRNRTAVMEHILPEYAALAELLDNLRPTCREFVGALERGEEDLDYYKLKMMQNSALKASSDEMAEQLDELIAELLTNLMIIYLSDPSSLEDLDPITADDNDEDIAYLKQLIENVYPAIPDQKITYVTIPDAVAEDFSPAAYLISAFDDPSRNIVMENPTADNSTMLFTLAHECFPGHLYQTQYFRNSDRIPLIQQLIAPTGYLEGWAVFSELMIAERAEKYGVNKCLAAQYNEIMINLLIPAYLGIRINCDGWTKSEVSGYLADFGLNEDAYIDVIYEFAIDMPSYFFNYAMGFTNTMRIYNEVDPQTDEEFLAFITRYLDYGPCSFDILFKKFGVK